MKTIFTPYQIKGISFKNRIVLPPLVRFSLLGTDGRSIKICWIGMKELQKQK